MLTANSEIFAKYGHIFEKQVDDVLPQWVLDNFSLEVVELNEEKARFELAHNPNLYRKIPGPDSIKLLSGQAIMALADTLLIFPVIAQVGQEKEFVTLNSTTEFLRPIRIENNGKDSNKVTIEAKVIRAGSKVIRGQVEIYDSESKLSALTTICYIYT